MLTTAPTRKRSRAQLLTEDQEEDEQQDELSQKKSDLRNNGPLLSNTKKRKLNNYGSSPVGASGIVSLGRKAASTLGGLFGFSDEKERGNLEVDELADEEEVDESIGKPEKDIYDFPSSEDEVEKKLRASARVKKKVDAESTKLNSTPQLKQKSNGKGSAKLGGRNMATDELVEEVDIYDVPDSEDDEPAKRHSAGKRLSSVNHAKASLTAAAKGFSMEPAKKRPRGRPKKVIEAEEEAEDEKTESGRSARRKKGQGKNVSSPVPRPEPQSSARRRGRPKRDLDAIVEAAKQPKGILTPSRKDRTLKSKKSVAFERPSDEIDLGFKSIPDSSVAKKKSRKSAEIEVVGPENGNTEDDKDVACSICDRRFVRKKNPILLCDGEGCKFAVHQKCYGIAEVPEGDWFCRGCRPEASSDEEDIEEAAPEDEAPREEDETEDDESCEICSELHSEKGNKIIFCDGCPFAVHQQCYQLPVVPRGAWYCRKCQTSRDEAALALQFDDEVALDGSPSNVPNIAGFEDHLRRAQRIVLDKLTGQKRIKLQGHDEEMQKVHQVVEQTVVAGEGNSILVIGARGCGKTALVESVISNLSADHRDSFHVVRLNGFIHTDDKLASKEIWRQLGREMEVEDDLSGKTSNYADTLASLLALLSHSSETSDTDQTAKSVVFILDEFDLFTTHSRQTLLYNLFDIAQARKAPIVVLGLTTRIDVVESLEKRVKSRFSHRYVHLSLPRSLAAFWGICKQGLVVDGDEFTPEKSDVSGQLEFVEYWQSMIEDLYKKDVVFKKYVESQFFRTKSVPAFFTSCILPIANLSPRNFPLTGKKLATNILSLSPPDSKLQILQGLSELELALLIAAARLDVILDTDTCNFAMVYDEYSSLTSRHKIQTSSTGVTALGSMAKVWGREIALGSWERLAEYNLLVPAGIGGAARDAGASARMWKVDVGLEEIAGSVEGLSGVMAKWCREI